MSDDVQVPCGQEWIADSTAEFGVCRTQDMLCPNCTELLALRRRVAELEATAARRLELLRPFAGLIVHDRRPDYSAEWPLYDAMSDSAEWCPEVNVGHVRAAAAEVAEGDGP